MQFNPLPISLPFEDIQEEEDGIFKPIPRCRVHVLPFKVYGDKTGKELLQLYGINIKGNIEVNSTPHEYIHWEGKGTLSFFENIVKGDIEEILRFSKPKDDIHIFTIHFTTGQLPTHIRIGKYQYNFKDIVHIMEDILIERFICIYDNRTRRNKVNTSIEVTCQPSLKGLIIFSKKNTCYLLKRKK